ncbi:DUF1531-domain-containing protein [Xylariaceae sp. FL0804]|nr:DUF1531-domain-containing protein [Xylariaceae sp. FL0804]
MSDELIDLVAHLGESVSNLTVLVKDRVFTNFGQSFTQMSAKQWIRMVIIVGTYLLVRPYFVKMGAKYQEKVLAKQQQESETQAEISPNQLRGQIDIPEDSDEDEDKAQATSADWGKKARRRQRNMIKKILDTEEKRLLELQEDEEDKDIAEYLEE